MVTHKVNSFTKLDLKCPHKSCVCSGFNSLLDLRKHLELNCQFTHFQCKFCEDVILRKNLNHYHSKHDYNKCAEEIKANGRALKLQFNNLKSKFK